jgi:hypothetical protein
MALPQKARLEQVQRVRVRVSTVETLSKPLALEHVVPAGDLPHYLGVLCG